MDKNGLSWYSNKHMRFRAFIILLLCATGALADVPGRQPARPKANRGEINGIFEQAKAILFDPNNSNVTTVPTAVEACTKQGHVGALCLWLDILEGKFKGLPADLTKAREDAKKYSRASAEFSPAFRAEACYRLALYQERGIGGKKDPEEAYHYMRIAGSLQLDKAIVEQGRYLMQGIGHRRDTRRAWKYLHSVAVRAPRTPNVFYYMGVLCYKGYGKKPDYRKAIRVFHMGARVGDANCINNLATMYERGIATRRDEETALYLYRKAAGLGNREASANMQRLAFKVDKKADKSTKRSAVTRVRNAAGRVILALPFSAYSRSRIRAWILGQEQNS